MSVASSVPSLKLPNPSTCCSSSSPNSSFYSYRTKPYHHHRHHALSISCSQTEGPIRRPVAPSPPPVMKPVPPSSPPPPSPSPPPPPKPTTSESNVVTLEFQRQKAKELQDYFKQKKLDEANEGPFFGFLPKNEIANGRWAMFGFAVGMLTEYATGADFVDQLKILLSNFGIIDLE